MTPEEVESQRRIARALMQQGMDSSPVQHWTQALARGAQGVVGAFQNDWADTAEREGRASGDKLIADALAGKNTSQAIQGMMRNPWASDTGRKLAVQQIGQRMQDESPRGKMELEAKRAQIDAAKWKLANDQSMAPLERQRLQAQISQAERAGELGRMELDQKRQMMPYQQRKIDAEIRALEQKDVMNEAIAEMLRGSGQQSPGPQMRPTTPPPPGQSPIRPQSMQGEERDPNLIRTQAAAQVGGQMPQQAEPDMVDTPMGRMPMQDAQRRAFALGLAGKGDAGKMLMDSAQAGKIGKDGRNDIDKKLIATSDRLARMEGLSQAFRPEWQTFEKQAEMYGLSWLDYFQATRDKLNPQQRQQLAEYTQYRQMAADNLNEYIREVTGAAVGVQEEARIRGGIPDPNKNSPTEFKARMDTSIRLSKMAWARYNYLLNNNFKGKPWESGIGLDDVPRVIDQRGQIIEQSLRQQYPNADPRQIQEGVRRQLKQEFGI